MGWVFGFGMIVGIVVGTLFSEPLMQMTAAIYFYSHPVYGEGGDGLAARYGSLERR